MEEVPSERRAGLLVLVRAAEPPVGELRRRHNAEPVARRLPPPVTVPFPFARVDAVDDGLRSALAIHLAGESRLEVELRHVGSFDDRVMAPLRSTWKQLLGFSAWRQSATFPLG